MGITFECPLEGHKMQVLVSSLTRVGENIRWTQQRGGYLEGFGNVQEVRRTRSMEEKSRTGLRTAWESILMTKKGHEPD